MHNPSIQTSVAQAAALVTVAALLLAASASAQPVITGLGSVTSTAINADGTAVAGNDGIGAFRWTRDGGLQDISTPDGAFFIRASAMSDDGTVITGYSSSFGGYRAYRWSVANGTVDLGSLTGGNTFAYGLSGDGATAAGTGAGPGGARAFRWNAGEGGMVGLGVLPGGTTSQATSANTDGTVIAGSCVALQGSRAFRWTSATGMVDLGLPSGAGAAQTYGLAVSGDGTAVVGYCAFESPSRNRATRWTAATGTQELGVLPGGADSIAYSVSGDGSIVVGTSAASAGNRAFLWTAPLGTVELGPYLASLGANTNGWLFTGAAAVSRDGTAVTGAATFNSQARAFLITGLPGCKPQIPAAPAPLSVCPGGAAMFTITATGNGPLSYRWYKNATAIDTDTNPSAATPQLQLAGVQDADAAPYRCSVTNACGSTFSPAARLYVDPADAGTAGGVPGRDDVHDNNDFVVFIDAFFNQLPSADLGSTGGVLGADGQFDNNDFVVFIDQFFSGC